MSPLRCGPGPNSAIAWRYSRSLGVSRSRRTRKKLSSSACLTAGRAALTSSMPMGDPGAEFQAAEPHSCRKYGYPPEARTISLTASGVMAMSASSAGTVSTWDASSKGSSPTLTKLNKPFRVGLGGACEPGHLREARARQHNRKIQLRRPVNRDDETGELLVCQVLEFIDGDEYPRRPVTSRLSGRDKEIRQVLGQHAGVTFADRRLSGELDARAVGQVSTKLFSTPSAAETAMETGPAWSRSRRICRRRIARRVRNAPVSGASIKPTLKPSWPAMSVKRFKRTVFPTPRRPSATTLFPGIPAAARRSATSNSSMMVSRPISAGGCVPAPGR